MEKFKSPFKDACDHTIPTTGPGNTHSEPNLPSGMPGRTGGLLPETIRDTNTVSGKPEWVSPKRQSFKFGTSD